MTVLTGNEIINKGIVENHSLNGIQAGGYDLRVSMIGRKSHYPITPRITRDNKDRVISDWSDMAWIDERETLWLATSQYRITFLENINIPSDCVGLIFPRSSLLRSDCTITTAVWDSGYSGHGFGYLIVNNLGGLHIERYSAVAQLVILKLDNITENLYQGIYQHE
jgi:dUTP pyrophosphatase